jgi:hypothetical protein
MKSYQLGKNLRLYSLAALIIVARGLISRFPLRRPRQQEVTLRGSDGFELTTWVVTS